LKEGDPMALAFKPLAAGLAMAMFGAYSSPIHAQPACAPMAVIEQMAAKHKELPVSFGKAEGGVDPYHLGIGERQDLDRHHGVSGRASGLPAAGHLRVRLGSRRAGG
jgi:hypothetical protein